MAIASDWIYQAAAIPVRNHRICMVTSSSGKRWVVPKGCLEQGKTAVEIALQEAWEEAGLVGTLHPEPVGSYFYDKWDRTLHVTVFLMQVTHVAEEWPEHLLRSRLWLKPEEALNRINDSGLQDVLRGLIRGRLLSV
jgi:8-oxo-dGTP pyrophosphatase MutT (NUDIX family)